MFRRRLMSCLTLVCVLSACDAGLNSGQAAANDAGCGEGAAPYFHCRAADEIDYYLCDAGPHSLEMRVFEDGKLLQSHRGEMSHTLDYEKYIREDYILYVLAFEGSSESLSEDSTEEFSVWYEISEHIIEDEETSDPPYSVSTDDGSGVKDARCEEVESRLDDLEPLLEMFP